MEQPEIANIFLNNLYPVDSITKQEYQWSKNENYIIKSQGQKYFLKIINDLPLEAGKITKNAQNIAYEKQIAPKNEFILQYNDTVVKCNQYIQQYEPEIFYRLDQQTQNKICQLFGQILSKLHNIDPDKITEARESIKKHYGEEYINEQMKILQEKSIISDEYTYRLIQKMNQYQPTPNDYVPHVSDFTTSNIIFDDDYTDGYIIDWEWLSIKPRAYALTGVWYRLVRSCNQSKERDEQIWSQLQNNYNYNIPNLQSETVRYVALLNIMKELNRFQAWNKGKSETEQEQQINNLEKRIDYL